MNEMLPYIAIIFSGLTLLLTAGEKVWGGGNALAAKFAALQRETAADLVALERSTAASIEKVKTELNDKISEYEKVATVGFDAVKSNIQIMREGLLEFRAKMAEELHHYIRKDDYNAGIGDIKRDVQNGFRNVEDRLGQMQDLIMYANPDVSHPRQPPKPR